MVNWRIVPSSPLLALTMFLFLVRLVFDPTASRDSESVSPQTLQLIGGVSQTLSFSDKRGGTLLRTHSQKARMSVEATPVKSAPRRTPLEAVPGCLRNKAPPGPTGTPLQPEAEPLRWHVGADAISPWQGCARERALIQAMEDDLIKS